MNEQIEVMKKNSQKFSNFMKAIFIILCIFIIFELGCVIYIAFQSSNSFSLEIDEVFNNEYIVFNNLNGFVSAEYNGQINSETGEPNYKASLLIEGITNILAHTFVAGIVFLVYKMLKDIKMENTPFITKNVKRLRIIAFLIILATIIPSWFSLLTNFFVFYNAQGRVTPISQMVIILGIAVFSIAYVFDYGCTIQKEIDETL